ncbi:MAG: MerC domain-containing protein [Lacibacter sp.]
MNFRINWEALGIGASIACAIHCAVVPLFISTLPLFGVNLVHNMAIEIILLGSAFLIGFGTLRGGYKKHSRNLPILYFTLGMVLFAANQFIIFPYSSFVFVIPAAALVVAAHIFNHRYIREAGACSVDGCEQDHQH